MNSLKTFIILSILLAIFTLFRVCIQIGEALVMKNLYSIYDACKESREALIITKHTDFAGTVLVPECGKLAPVTYEKETDY